MIDHRYICLPVISFKLLKYHVSMSDYINLIMLSESSAVRNEGRIKKQVVSKKDLFTVYRDVKEGREEVKNAPDIILACWW